MFIEFSVSRMFKNCSWKVVSQWDIKVFLNYFSFNSKNDFELKLVWSTWRYQVINYHYIILLVKNNCAFSFDSFLFFFTMSSFNVFLYIYDLSRGTAKLFSPSLLGKFYLHTIKNFCYLTFTIMMIVVLLFYFMTF